jgi:hypothetical protein
MGVVSPYANAMSIGFTARGTCIPQMVVVSENLSRAMRVPSPSPSNVSVMGKIVNGEGLGSESRVCPVARE